VTADSKGCVGVFGPTRPEKRGQLGSVTFGDGRRTVSAEIGIPGVANDWMIVALEMEIRFLVPSVSETRPNQLVSK